MSALLTCNNNVFQTLFVVRFLFLSLFIVSAIFKKDLKLINSHLIIFYFLDGAFRF